MTRPACMSEDEHAAWLDANESVMATRSKASSPCVDCTPAFAAEMRLIDSCDGEPRVEPEPVPRTGAYHVALRREREGRIEAARELLLTGLSRAEVASAMGVTKPTVTRYLLEAG